MVKEFLRTPRHSVQTRGSASETPLSPVQSTTDILSEGKPQNGTRRTHSKVFQTRSSDGDIAQKTSVQNSHGKRTLPDKEDPDNRLLERVASELYHCQENLLDLSRTISSPSMATDREEDEREEEEDKVVVENGVGRHSMSNRHLKQDFHPPSAPSPATTPLRSQDSYSDLLTILENSSGQDDSLSPPQFRPKLGTIAVHVQSTPKRSRGQGYHTLQRDAKQSLIPRDSSDLSRTTESYGYEGPPSPRSKEEFSSSLRVEGEGRRAGGKGKRASAMLDMKKLRRKTAIRRQRRRGRGSISEPPPETSYSYHVSLSFPPAFPTVSPTHPLGTIHVKNAAHAFTVHTKHTKLLIETQYIHSY